MRKLKYKAYVCQVCGNAFRSQRGAGWHYHLSHTYSSKAERNWVISRLVLEDNWSLLQVAEEYKLTVSSISRIVGRYMQNPMIYEIDPELTGREFSPAPVPREVKR